MGTRVVTVKNRTNKAYEFTFDGQVYIVPPLDTESMLAEVAAHGIRKSIISFNLATGQSVRALVMADSPEAAYEIDARTKGSELIERDPADGEVETKTFSNPDMRGGRVSSSLDGE